MSNTPTYLQTGGQGGNTKIGGSMYNQSSNPPLPPSIPMGNSNSLQQNRPPQGNPQQGYSQQGNPSHGNQTHSSNPPMQMPSLSNMHGAVSNLKKTGTMQDECHSFANYLNSLQKLREDPALSGVFAINPNDDSLYNACAQSLLLSKFINTIRPGTIDERRLVARPKNLFEATANHESTISGARTLGCKITNIGADDIAKGTNTLILGILWQLIRFSLLSNVNLQQHPEIIALKEDNEDVNQFVNMAPEMTLLRWFNHHLRAAGYSKRVTNFSTDLIDGDSYTILLHEIAPLYCGLEPLQEQDPLRKAEMILKNTEKIGCRQFLQPQDIVNGNEKLNLAFCANLFNSHPSLSKKAQEVANRNSSIEIEQAIQQQLQRKEQELRQRMAQEEELQRNRLQAMEQEWKERMKREEEMMKQKWMEEERQRRAQLQSEKEKQMSDWEREQAMKNQEWLKAQQEQNAWTQQKLTEIEREKQRILEERKQLEQERQRRSSQPPAPWTNQPTGGNTGGGYQNPSNSYQNNTSTQPSTTGGYNQSQRPNQPQGSIYQGNQTNYSSQIPTSATNQPLYPSTQQSSGKPSYANPKPTYDNPYNTTAPMGILKDTTSPASAMGLYGQGSNTQSSNFNSSYSTSMGLSQGPPQGPPQGGNMYGNTMNYHNGPSAADVSMQSSYGNYQTGPTAADVSMQNSYNQIGNSTQMGIDATSMGLGNPVQGMYPNQYPQQGMYPPGQYPPQGW